MCVSQRKRENTQHGKSGKHTKKRSLPLAQRASVNKMPTRRNPKLSLHDASLPRHQRYRRVMTHFSGYQLTRKAETQS